jgi:hypothetical protein
MFRDPGAGYRYEVIRTATAFFLMIGLLNLNLCDGNQLYQHHLIITKTKQPPPQKKRKKNGGKTHTHTHTRKIRYKLINRNKIH